ncbi:MAG: glycoside hydrolase family 43 protein [Armatimonadetes bacterium]|nr:glycoside hydrolase family 43 protein [Armatimonadota bacterium]
MADVLTPNIETKSEISYTNPVFESYFADPFACHFGPFFYAVGTGGAITDDNRVFQLLRSENLVNWTSLGLALIKPEGFEDGCYWAPEITEIDGTYYMVYSVGQGDKNHQIRVAAAPSPEGPYRDQGQLTDPQIPFAIDPHIYLHTDGHSYLYYATDFLDGDRPGTSLVVDRMISATQLAGQPVVVARATSDWQRYQSSRPIYGKTLDWHTLEGPSVVRHEGKIYVFYSGGNWQNETYGVDFVSADHPLGPYTNTTLDRPRVLRTIPGKIEGPGHNSIVLGPDNQTLVAVYHAWNPDRSARLMRIDPIQWTPDGPIIDGPSLSQRSIFRHG